MKLGCHIVVPDVHRRCMSHRIWCHWNPHSRAKWIKTKQKYYATKPATQEVSMYNLTWVKVPYCSTCTRNTVDRETFTVCSWDWLQRLSVEFLLSYIFGTRARKLNAPKINLRDNCKDRVECICDMGKWHTELNVLICCLTCEKESNPQWSGQPRTGFMHGSRAILTLSLHHSM